MTQIRDVAAARDQRVQRAASGHSHSSTALPPELVAEGARRLAWLGLIYASGTLLSHFGGRFVLIFSGSIQSSLGISDAFGVASVLLGIGVFFVARSRLLSHRRLLDLGLAFQVAGAFGIAVSGMFDPSAQLADIAPRFLPAEAVWIVMYPLVVPNTPRRILIASLLAASTGPVAFWFRTVIEGGAPGGRLVEWSAYFLVSNYLSAIVSYTIARVVHRFGLRFKQLRDIGSYELVERIGEGGMGEVWRATHRLLQRPAAIKLIRRDVLGSNQRAHEAMTRRFEREAQDTATLGSVHTIDVYDFGTTEEGDFYYVMELLDGISLERFVKTFGPMEPARVVYLLRQVCHSLREAHARGLLHRDVKPANIFMCRLGPDDDFIKVLDFGLVKHFEAPGGSMLTIDGSTAGTPAYMAPEIALGRRDVDGRADVYSLGCVAYYLLTGEPVFAGDTPIATALAHVNEKPVAPSVRSELAIPPALDALILECLAKNPADRPASAGDLEQCLAATVPEGSWTPKAARAWWELHHAGLTGGTSKRAPAAAATAGERRCWPKLDQKPLTPRSVAGQ